MMHHRKSDWSISYSVPVNLPKFVLLRSAQHRLKNPSSARTYGHSVSHHHHHHGPFRTSISGFGSGYSSGGRPTAVVRPLVSSDGVDVTKSAFKSSEIREKIIAVKKDDSPAVDGQAYALKQRAKPTKTADDSNKGYTDLDNDALKRRIQQLEYELNKVQNDLAIREKRLAQAEVQLERQIESAELLAKEKKTLEDMIEKHKDTAELEQKEKLELSKTRAKCEQLVDVISNQLEAEKRSKQEKEREARRLESDLSSARTSLTSVQNDYHQLESLLNGRTDECRGLAVRLESQQQLVAKLQEDFKLYQERIKELERLLSQEREQRLAAENCEQGLRQKLDKTQWKLDQAEKLASAREEQLGKRDHDLQTYKEEAAKSRAELEFSLENTRKKHAEQIAQTEQQLEQVRSEKTKAERDRSNFKAQMEEAQTTVDILTKDKLNLEKQRNKMELKAYEHQLKLEEVQGTLAEAAGARQKLNAENDKLANNLRESKTNATTIDRERLQLKRELDSMTESLNDETKKRQQLAEQVKQFGSEKDTLKSLSLQDETIKTDLTRQLGRANTEILSLHTKLEQCSLAQAELLEQQKNYYTNKLTQAQQENETLTSRVASLERLRQQLKQETEDLITELENAQSTFSGYEKKIVGLDKQLRDWEQRYKEINEKVVAVEDELRTASSELKRTKTQLDDSVEEVACLRAENIKFKSEVHELQMQIAELQISLRESDKAKRRFVEENDELNKNLETSEKRSQFLMGKLAVAEADLSNVNKLVEERIKEKAEEFEAAKRELKDTVDDLQSRVEDEKLTRDKAVREKNSIERRISELETMLDEANRSRAESVEQLKKLHQLNQELSLNAETSARDAEQAQEHATISEKRSAVLLKEREEMAAALIQVEKARQELGEENLSLKQQLFENEADLSAMKCAKQELQSAADDARLNLQLATDAAERAETKAGQATSESIALSDQLRNEREKVAAAEQKNLELENTIKDQQNKIERLERNALMNSEQAVLRAEQLVRDLEAELKQERHRLFEVQKAERCGERSIKELQFQLDQERLRGNRMADVVENLEQKLRVYKRQREDAEEAANVNLAKCRTLQHELDDVEGRADAAEIVLTRIRAENRARISGLLTPSSITGAEVIAPYSTRRSNFGGPSSTKRMTTGSSKPRPASSIR